MLCRFVGFNSAQFPSANIKPIFTQPLPSSFSFSPCLAHFHLANLKQIFTQPISGKVLISPFPAHFHPAHL